MSAIRKEHKSLRIIVTGGRDYWDRDYLRQALDMLRPVVVHQGGASGADVMAKIWCVENGVPCAEWPAYWRAQGKSAGPRRNLFMLLYANVDLVVAFPGDKGTSDCIGKAIGKGIPVLDLREEPKL